MNSIFFPALLAVMAMSGAAAQGQPSKAKVTTAQSKALFEQALNTLRITAPLSLKPPVGSPEAVDCSSDPRTVCDRKMYLVLGSTSFMLDGVRHSKDICVATAYDVKVNVDGGGGRQPKRISYTLEVKDPKILTPEFIDHVDVQKDDDKDFAGHSRGAGNQSLTVKTSRKVSGKEIVFLPLIKWKNGSDWDLCAALDPKIVNAD